MRPSRIIATGTIALVIGAGAALSDPIRDAIDARQAQFKLFAYNIGPLVQMAQGNIDYDAELAQRSADNLAALTHTHQDRHWPEGSDNATVDDTRAMPSIWEDLEDFQAKFSDLREATSAMQDVAGEDLASLRGALGPVGNACSACHDANRAEE